MVRRKDHQLMLAFVWAAALLGSAVAARFDVIGAAFGQGLFYGLLLGAGASIIQASRPARC